MSLIQVEDLVSYQLRSSYLNEVADGVGERLITLNDSILNTGPFKAAGWHPNPALIKRTHSPPIPTAIAAEYFQAAPRSVGLTLEDDVEEGGILTGGMGETPGPGIATKRRRERRREQMEEDDSSDLSDESDDETDQRAAQQIRFAKMPLRNRSGSSPIQSSTLRQTTTMSSPRAAPGARRGSQSALETVKERARRDTVTSSEVSSDNEFDASAFRRQRENSRTAAKTAKIQTRIAEEPSPGVDRVRSDLLAEEEDDSELSDGSSAFVESVGSASILAEVENPAVPASPGQQVVGTPPKQLLRQSTIRKPQTGPAPRLLDVLPPPRPMSTIRPLSMIQPRSLLSDAFKAKKTKPAMPFEQFASLSGQGDPDPLSLRIYAPFSKTASKPFEVLIRRNLQEDDGTFRPVTVAELIGLSLWRYQEEKLEPPIPNDKLNVNWWTLRMVDGDEVDDDFPPLERKKPVNAFTTANNRAARSRSTSKTYDDFGLVQASESGFQENQKLTPQFEQQEVPEDVADDEITPANTQPPAVPQPAPTRPRVNPITNTSFRMETAHADKPAPPPQAATPISRGQHKLLRVHILSSDVPPGQMVTLDVTTDTYLAEVLDMVCKKRQLDKSTHVLKLPGSGPVVFVDRAVSSIGNVTDLELHRRRFATDGPLTINGSPIGSSPKQHMWEASLAGQKKKKDKGAAPHPLAREPMMLDEAGSSNVTFKKYIVWKKQTMRFVGNERLLTIDGEYVYIQPSSGGKPTRESGKTSSVHFSNILNCTVSRKHPGTFKLYIFKEDAPKRTDYEAKNPHEAAEIVAEIKKGVAPYNKDI
ncbi:stress-activated map kinase-interacting protein [Xylariales sp. PMI_506]|nr:stress-activated map kinase-interacting protein [Xylariales sp. PMI_506]